jgi:translocator protein
MKKGAFPRLLAAIAICEFAGAVGAIFTAPAIPIWYASLARPLLSPPNWIFMPVWTILFALMGVALWLITEKPAPARERRAAHQLFVFQLALNVAWSFIFFGLHVVSAAFIEMVSLWLVILATIIAFSKISKTAAWLLVPYIVWVSFAAYLNLSIWLLNF